MKRFAFLCLIFCFPVACQAQATGVTMTGQGTEFTNHDRIGLQFNAEAGVEALELQVLTIGLAGGSPDFPILVPMWLGVTNVLVTDTNETGIFLRCGVNGTSTDSIKYVPWLWHNGFDYNFRLVDDEGNVKASVTVNPE